MMTFSVLVTLSSSSWLVCWMMMEVSSFFFVPLLYGFWSVSSTMISLKYFLVQSFGSSIFIFTVLMESISCGGWEWVMEDKVMGLLTCLSMMLKLGVFPFNGWMIHISENLSWKNFFLLSSIQEVIPLIMISKFGGSESFILFFVCISMLTMMMFCFLNYSIHYMVVISSLFNVCWMVTAALVSKSSMIYFILVYFSTLYLFLWMLESVVSVDSLSSVSSFSLFKGGKMVFILTCFMMMGVPPFGNFLGKVEVLSEMISSHMVWLSIYFLLISSMFMFLYLKISLCISLEMKGGWMMPKLKVKSMGLVALGISVMLFMIWMF